VSKGPIEDPVAEPAGRQKVRTVQRSVLVWTVSRALAKGFCKVWFRHEAEGSANIPQHGPVLLVANHSSYLDPAVLGISTRRWIGYLAQAGLARFAPFRWWMAQVGVTLIDRDAPGKEAMRIVIDCLRAGEAVGVFPEGTRSKDGSIGPFRTGVEFFVRRTGVVVVPVGIDGAWRAWPRGKWLPRPKKIVVRFGEPWPAERVLADGGIEALRARVAELAHAPLREQVTAQLTEQVAAQLTSGDRRSDTSSSSAGGGA